MTNTHEIPAFNTPAFNMIEGQLRPNGIIDGTLLRAISKIDRSKFVPDPYKPRAYSDAMLPLNKQRTILSPLTQARLLDLADLTEECSVLVVGAGCGYLAAVAAQYTKLVLAAEQDKELVEKINQTATELAIDNLILVETEFKTLPKNKTIQQQIPVEAIIFEGKLEVPPNDFFDLLAENGRLIMIGTLTHGVDGMIIYTKQAGHIGRKENHFCHADILPGFEFKSGFSFV